MISFLPDIIKLSPVTALLILLISACSIDREEAYVVEVMAFDYAFNVPEEVPSGWIAFVLNNEMAHEIHEISVAKIPEGIGYAQYLSEYVGAWEILLQNFQDGEIERSELGERAQELLPEWERENRVEYINARGLLAAGRIASKTVYLEPGNYALDCWVKTKDGIIHISTGMTRPLTVTEASTNSPEPNPEASITLFEDEIAVENWEPRTGHHQFAMYMDSDDDGNGFYNNVHLVRIEEETDLHEVNNWMDWYSIGGLRAPAPADFLGGTSTYDADPGEDATYFSLTITEPGDYAWIVHTRPDNPLWKTFSVDE